MEVGTLLVKLSSETSGFTRGLGDAIASADAFAKRIKKLSGDVANVGLAMTAFGGAMTALAATVDSRAKSSLEGLKTATAGVAVQISDILEPAVRTITDVMKQLGDVIGGLSPELKAMLSDFGMWGAVLGVAAIAVSKVSGALSALLSVAGAVFGVLSAPVVAFIVALTAVVAVVAVIVDNWSTFEVFFLSVVKNISTVWGDVVASIVSQWSTGLGIVVEVLRNLAKTYVAITALIKGGAALAGVGGNLAAVDAMADKARDAFSKQNLLPTILETAKTAGVVLGDALSVAAKSMGSGLEKMFNAAAESDVVKRLAALFSGGHVRAPSGLPGKGASAKDSGPFRYSWEEPGSRISNTTPAALGNAAAKRQQEREEESAKNLSLAFSTITSKMGELGSVINNIAQGASQGGVWGAFLAAIMEIVSRMGSFTRMLGKAMDAIQAIADFVDMTLGPIFDVIGGIIDGITAAFNWLKANTDSAENRGSKTYTGAQILSTNLATAKASGNAVAIAGAQADIAAFEKMLGMSIDTILAPSVNLADAMAKAAAEANKGADAQAKLNERLSESLTNVPAGVKVALARFNATAEASVGPGAVAHEAPYSVGPVYVNAAAGKQLWDELVGIAKGEADLRMGNSASIMRALKGA